MHDSIHLSFLDPKILMTQHKNWPPFLKSMRLKIYQIWVGIAIKRLISRSSSWYILSIYTRQWRRLKITLWTMKTNDNMFVFIASLQCFRQTLCIHMLQRKVYRIKLWKTAAASIIYLCKTITLCLANAIPSGSLVSQGLLYNL